MTVASAAARVCCVSRQQKLAGTGRGRYPGREMRFGRGGRGRWRIRRVPLGALAGVLVVLLIWTVHEARKPGPWQRVFATREGLTGGRMATGEIIQPGDRFVALPHPSALRRDVEIRYQGRALVVPVMDVGPWNTDDAYWSSGQRPA